MSWACPCGEREVTSRCEKCGRWQYGKDHKIETLIVYMAMKIKERDWHAVSDAANDLRVLEANS